MTQVESSLRRYVSRLGLLPLAFVVWRTAREWSPSLVLRNRAARRGGRRSPEIPPNSLIFSSTATKDVSWYLESARRSATSFRNALSDLNRPLESFARVLDFGCGSGRVLREWADVRGPEFFGCDYNSRAVAWVQKNLTFVTARNNSLAPPLPFETEFFDLCYSVSVFTHLPETMQRPWIEELHRILLPGGILMLTLSGEADLGRLTGGERRKFATGELVVIDGDLAGTNMCGVYHPEQYIRDNWPDLFEIEAIYPAGATGSPNQDLYVFRKPG